MRDDELRQLHRANSQPFADFARAAIDEHLAAVDAKRAASSSTRSAAMRRQAPHRGSIIYKEARGLTIIPSPRGH